MTVFVASEIKPPADAVFWRCLCGAPIWQHSRHNQDGNQIWAGSSSTGCERFRASDGSAWPNTYGGATLDTPADLDLNTVHWIDGRVYLTGDEPPL